MRFAIVASLMVSCGVAAVAQSAPVKMGLWESARVITRGGSPTTVKSQFCITPENYKDALGMAIVPPAGCKVNTTKNANGYTFDGGCTGADGATMRLNGMEAVDDSEHTRAASHTITTATKDKPSVEVDMKASHRFVSASCGAVTPDKPVTKN
jgi:hypothetical protein